jgi:hypothetical protein
MCDCKALINEHLAERNTVLSETTLINRKTGALRQSLIIRTERLCRDKPRTKVKMVLPSFCPFCGDPVKPEPVEA